MLQRLLHFFWRSPRPARSLPQLLSAPEEARPGPGSLVRINVEAWDPAEQHALHTVAAETAKITFYTGKVQHGYALSVVMTPERCPSARPARDSTMPTSFMRRRQPQGSCLRLLATFAHVVQPW
jgi:hypothetical protein